ncbi:hypothetical protein STAS_18887 [Striga asiatica]|uniref:Uncharacterized protein n=1 Tax=Striga asiatica TaxID=4170 RepID=A0A5A7QA34_STRAF|nr:hypothetical protein STAS_18887 [Striga asiatica]
MVARTNRSPSPLPSRPTNQNPRNSEMYSATRKSFNGNNILKPYALTNPRRFDPVTPASSPSDFSRRRSVSRDCEEKENNEKDQNQRTPKLHPSSAKGSKNFMAPTISAASKFTPSPRKKPLVERNDPLRTSISLSDGKAMFFSNASEDLEPKPDMNSANSGKKEPFQEALQAPKPFKKVTFPDVPLESLSDSVITDFDCSKMESFSKENNISCSPISTPIAPLDADPSMPSYDPKTNFLAPRPQFLYYRPNPRVEIFLNNEKEMGDSRNSEKDNFMSDNLSEKSVPDSEGTEAYERDMVIGLEFSEVNDFVHDSRDSEKEKLEVTIASSELVDLKLPKVVNGDIRAPEDTEKENMEAIASEDMFEGVDVEDDDFLNEKSNFVEKSNKKKPWKVSRLVCFSVVAMMMLLMAACVSLSVTQQSPSFGKFGFTKDLGFEAATNVKVIFDELARRVNQLSVYSIDFISKVTDELGKEETQLGPLKYMNLSSDLQMDSWDDFAHFSSKNEVSENFTENDDDELYEEMDAEIENFEEEIEAYKENNDSVENLEEELDTRENEMPGVIVHYVPADHLASIISQVQENQAEAKIEVFPPETMEIEKSNVDSINHGPDDNTALLDQDSSSDVNSLTEGAQSSFASENEFLTHYYTIAVSTLLAALLAFAAAYFSYYRRKTPSLCSANLIQANNNSMKQLGKEDDDVISKSSCPSAMSSFQKNVSSYNNGKKTRKNHSKREPLASSSSEFTTGSPSYGSFTTFEKIPVKNANGEEEIITPVRRSNRIRNYH